MKKFYVYVYLDPRIKGDYNYIDFKFDYEPFYVGKGSGYRYLDHLRLVKKNSHKVNRIKNIIADGYEPIILKIFENLNENDSYEKEIEIIKKIGRRVNNTGPLTNFFKGGIGNGLTLSDHPNREQIILKMKKNKIKLKHSEETKNKIRDHHRTKEYREKMSNKMKNVVNITDEIKEKISKTLKSKNIKRNDETKKKISKANKNRIHSDSSRKNMSLAHIGNSIFRFKYTLISPDNKIYTFIGENELSKFIKLKNMSLSLIKNNFNNNKKIIIKRTTIKTKNTENWISKREKYEL